MKTNPGLQTEPANTKRDVLRKCLFISGGALVLLIVAVLIALPRLNFKPAAASRNVQCESSANGCCTRSWPEDGSSHYR